MRPAQTGAKEVPTVFTHEEAGGQAIIDGRN